MIAANRQSRIEAGPSPRSEWVIGREFAMEQCDREGRGQTDGNGGAMTPKFVKCPERRPLGDPPALLKRYATESKNCLITRSQFSRDRSARSARGLPSRRSAARRRTKVGSAVAGSSSFALRESPERERWQAIAG